MMDQYNKDIIGKTYRGFLAGYTNDIDVSKGAG